MSLIKPYPWAANRVVHPPPQGLKVEGAPRKMKDYMIGWQQYETTFDGEPVRMELSPLKRGEFLRLLPILDAFYKLSKASTDSAGITVEQADGLGSLIARIEGIICDHVRDIRGFTVNGVDPPPVEEVLSAAVFMPLVSEIVLKLVEISKVSKADEKNFAGQSTNQP